MAAPGSGQAVAGARQDRPQIRHRITVARTSTGSIGLARNGRRECGRARAERGAGGVSILKRFTAKYVVSGDGCWRWHGALQPTGYGMLWNGRRPEQAHRVAYKLFIGEIPDGCEIDHICRNRSCVNPSHLRAVSHRENMRVSDTPMGRNARKTSCKRGHHLAGNNLRHINGTRQCRECMNLRARLAKFRKRTKND